MALLLYSTALAFFSSLGARFLVETFIQERIPLLGAFVGLERTENVGVAFGIVLPSPLQGTLVGIALLAILILAYRSRGHRLSAFSFGLILGGALANIVDRFGDGRVTDFFQVGTFPTFNVADSCITVGVGVLLLLEFFKGSHGSVLR